MNACHDCAKWTIKMIQSMDVIIIIGLPFYSRVYFSFHRSKFLSIRIIIDDTRVFVFSRLFVVQFKREKGRGVCVYKSETVDVITINFDR